MKLCHDKLCYFGPFGSKGIGSAYQLLEMFQRIHWGNNGNRTVWKFAKNPTNVILTIYVQKRWQ